MVKQFRGNLFKGAKSTVLFTGEWDVQSVHGWMKQR